MRFATTARARDNAQSISCISPIYFSSRVFYDYTADGFFFFLLREIARESEKECFACFLIRIYDFKIYTTSLSRRTVSDWLGLVNSSTRQTKGFLV